jgi:glyoxylase-like metal-dependent hydrolase (beta-lactamase superfamily II)
MQLTPWLSLVGSGNAGFNLTDDYDCHVYLLHGGGELALIDAGGGRDQAGIVAQIEADGYDPRQIRKLFLTHAHADHSAGSAGWHAAFGVEVCVAAEAAEALRTGDERWIYLDVARTAGLYPPDFTFPACPVAHELRDGDELPVGDLTVRALATPGHADGHFCFLVDVDGQRALFTGDLLFYGGKVLLLNTAECRPHRCAQSLEKLRNLGVDLLLPGHQTFSLKNGQRHVDAALKAFDALVVPPNLL